MVVIFQLRDFLRDFKLRPIERKALLEFEKQNVKAVFGNVEPDGSLTFDLPHRRTKPASVITPSKPAPVAPVILDEDEIEALAFEKGAESLAGVPDPESGG